MLVFWLSRSKEMGLASYSIYTAANKKLRAWCEEANLDVIEYSDFSNGKKGKFEKIYNAWKLFWLVKRVHKLGPVLMAPGSVQSAFLYTLAAACASRRLVVYVPMAFPSKIIGFRYAVVRDFITSLLVKRFSHWITISPRQRDLLVDCWGITRPISVISNSNTIKANGVLSSEPATNGRTRLLFLGRFDAHQKGLDWLFAFFLRKPELVSRFSLTLQGEGALTKPIALAIKELAAIDGAFLKFKTWGDPSKVFGEHDALILPSRFEGVPLVGLEAIDFSLPVVASAQAGLSELLPDEAQFCFGADGELERCLNFIFDKENREKLLVHERKKYREYVDPAKIDSEIKKSIQEILLNKEFSQ